MAASVSLMLGWKTVKSSFLTMMWPHQGRPCGFSLSPTPYRPVPSQCYVIDSLCDLGVNQLSTFKAGQLVWGWPPNPPGSQKWSALGFLKEPVWAGGPDPVERFCAGEGKGGAVGFTCTVKLFFAPLYWNRTHEFCLAIMPKVYFSIHGKYRGIHLYTVYRASYHRG